jgi:hypothetical protein
MDPWSDEFTNYLSPERQLVVLGGPAISRLSVLTAERLKRAKLRWTHSRRSDWSGADGSIRGSGAPSTKDKKEAACLTSGTG